MKFKSITALVVLLLVGASVFITGCTSPTSQQQTTSSTTSVVTTGIATTADLMITAQPVQLSPKVQNASQKVGFKYVAYNCTVKNVGTIERHAATNAWTLRDTQGGVYDNVLGVQNLTKPWNPSGQVLPGDTIYGVVVFEVPANVQQFKSITYHDVYTDNGIFKAGPNIAVTLSCPITTIA